MSLEPFAGYPQDALVFLRELELNNNRPWFEDNKQRYLQSIVEPTQAFVLALGAQLQRISPAIQYDTRTNGQGSMMRIYRDVRFSKDKTPYKTYVTMAFWEGPLKKMQNPSFGMRFGEGEGGLMAGIYGFQKEQLEAYRQAVDNSETAAALEVAIAEVRRAGNYIIGGAHYKRVPRGYEADHPRANLLKYNGLYVYAPEFSPELITSPELVNVCYEHCRNMAPVQQWLVKSLF